MLREFNVHLEDVEMLGGADSLLEGTNVTKVVVRGDSKLSSLNSFLKNCSEIDRIEGELDLNGVSSLDNAFKNTPLMNSVTLKNINNNEITSVSAFDDIEEVNVSGICSKPALQNIISSTNWNDEKFNYINEMADTITNKSKVFNDSDNMVISDTLEQKAKGIEIVGQTYENLVAGNGEVTLLDELTLESIEGSPKEFNPHVVQPVCVEVVEGNTVQDESNIYSIGELQEDGTYKIDILSNNLYQNKFDLVNANISNVNCNHEKLKNGIKVYSSGSGYRYIRTNVALKKGTLYYIQYTVNDVLNSNSGKVVIGGYNGDNQVFSNSQKGVVNGSFVANSDVLYILMYSNASSTANPQEIIYSDIIISETPPLESTQSILLPQPLNKIGELKDKFYWDEDKGHYCIEQNVNSDLTILDGSNVIDLPHLNKKYSLDTYIPTTYLECANSPIQPSKMTLKSDIVKYKPIFLDQNKEYQVKFDCKQKGNSIKLRLGEAEKTITPTLGENTVSITTPQKIVDSRLYLIGANNKLSNVYVIADNMSTGELQEDGTYKINISTTNQTDFYDISIIANKPLGTDDKLYWNKSDKRYEIDRNGEIETPTVTGDVVDLPRLYQKEDTYLSVETGNIKPSEIKIEYLDID